MMKKLFLIFLAFSFSNIFGQLKTDLNINFKLRGDKYVQTSIEDTTALGGFAKSDNLPKKYVDSLNSSEVGLILKIDINKSTSFENKYNGYKLYLINKTNNTVGLDASDSRLDIVGEVFYKGKWQAIEYLPSSTCGNSYHTVFLKQNEFWEFDIPKFNGKINTKLRYKLTMNKSNLYSNEIPTSINKNQMLKIKKYNQNGLMDPYNE